MSEDTAGDLRIVGVTVESIYMAESVIEEMDEQTVDGVHDVREIAVVSRSPKGRVRVRHVHSHATTAGGTVGGALELGAAIVAGAALLPALVCLPVLVWGGRRAGRAVADHRSATTRDFLDGLGAGLEDGRVVVLAVLPADGAPALVQQLRTDFPDLATLDVSAADQQAIIEGAREAVAETG